MTVLLSFICAFSTALTGVAHISFPGREQDGFRDRVGQRHLQGPVRPDGQTSGHHRVGINLFILKPLLLVSTFKKNWTWKIKLICDRSLVSFLAK